MVINKLKKSFTKEHLATSCLFLFSFFLPVGYDALFALVMKWTGSYWTTDLIFYLISGVFFILYILLRRSIKKEQ